jgi:hypothetical protein
VVVVPVPEPAGAVGVAGEVGEVGVVPGVAVGEVGEVGVVVEGMAVAPADERGEFGMGGAAFDGSPGLLPPPHAAANRNIIAANNCVR